MKLQKLIIHNIASIEDATIDFEAKPLSDSEVFLITGKTGSGKSTILDAICLALYGETPRLKNTLMKDDITDAQSTIKSNDTRQLLRRNTGEGFVRLTFIGSNGVSYVAEWGVRRAHNRISGNLQGKKWSITDLDTGKSYTKDKDIEAVTDVAIGLKFDQFCRTTILAQGEFTRFLNSKEDDKAAILEKITGVDVYTKIGKKVFDLTSLHKKEYEDANRKLEGVKILTDEELTEKAAQIKSLSDQANQIAKGKAEIDKKLLWISDDTKLKEQKDTAQANYDKAAEKLNSDEYRTNLDLINEWDSIIDVRKYKIDIDNAAKRKNDLNAKLIDDQRTFETLRNGIAWRNIQLEQLQADIDSLQKAIDAEKSNVDIYNNVQAIEGKISTIIADRSRIQILNSKLEENQTKLKGKLTQDVETADKQVAEANEKIADSENKINALKDELQDLNVQELRDKHSQFTNKSSKLDRAKDMLATLHREEERIASTRKGLAELADKIKTKNDDAAALAKELEAAKQSADDLLAQYEKQKQTVDDWAKDIRRKLKVGDHCPICGKTIDEALPNESELAQLYAIAEDNYKKANDNFERLRNDANRLSAEIKADTSTYDSGMAKLAADKAVDNVKAELLALCKDLAIDTIDEHTAEAFERIANELQSSLTEISAAIKKAELKEQEIDKEQKSLNSYYKVLDVANTNKNKATEAYNNCRNAIQNDNETIKEKQNEIAQATADIDQLLANSVWSATWQANPSQLVTDLKTKAELYNGKVDSLRLKNNELGTRNTSKQYEDEAHDNILAIMPEGFATTFEIPEKVDNLLTKLNELFSSLKSAQDGIKQAEVTEAEAREQLATFFNEHPEIDQDRLTQLADIKPEKIEKLRKEQEQIRSDVKQANSLLTDLGNRIQAHNESKPQFEVDETAETLKVKASELEKTVGDLREQVGGLKHELEQDENNKRSRHELIDEMERLKGIYIRWSKLSDLIGDKEGTKFRRVAQSYILGSLIRSANQYMRTLTDRYTLLVTPGTSVISIEDAYQGYARRAATTISGGESFLVSLSLALALADIGKQLAVDTMFIDEGFGTLSGEPLRCAVNTLKSLHSTAGRHVGIISHVEELRERIPVQIQVNQQGNNSSSQIQVVTI